MSFGKFRDDKDPAGSSATTPSAATTSSSSSSSGRAEAFLGRGSKVVGTLTFTGPVELDGNVEGEINAKETLTIGESAVINAKVVGADVVIRGTVTGDIITTKKLTLKKPARVTGNLSSPALSIEEGVHFEGKCSMTAAAVSTPSSHPDNKAGSKSAGAIA